MFVSRSDSAITVLAPAKLNLHLEVLARRADGYHEIETVIAAVSLFDTVCFLLPQADSGRGRSSGIYFHGRWASGFRGRFSNRQSLGGKESKLGDLPEGTDNLVVKAVDLLARRAGIEAAANVLLVKRIPSAAGLGGGSSDAAAALLAANEGFGLRWSRDRLAQLAAELGSDVPFFLSSGAAVCRGRGERIEPATDWKQLHFVVISPPHDLSTKEVYRGCLPAESPTSTQPLVEALRNGDPVAVGRRLSNRLEGPAGRISSWIDRLRYEMEQVDVPGHRMTGSGSSYFAVCRNAMHARRTAGRLRGRNLGQVFRVVNVRFSIANARRGRQTLGERR